MIVTLSKLLLHGEFNRPFWDHKEDGYGGALLSNPVARKVLCVPEPPLRFCKLMDAQHCLVINLSKGQLGADTANVMGRLLLASIVIRVHAILPQVPCRLGHEMPLRGSSGCDA